MKNLIIFILPFLLFSCFWESEEVKKAKEEIFNNSTNKETATTNNINSTMDPNKSYFELYYETFDKFIDLELIKNVENITDTLDINWIVTNQNIDKITVSFSNQTSSFPEDKDYKLTTFKKWNKSFLYRAYTKYQVLDYWLNQYIINAYIWDKIVSTLKLNLYIAKKEILNNINQTQNIIYTGSVDDFNIINDESVLNINCENIDDFLSSKYTWYYWNTCRPLKVDESIYVNVLSLHWDNYKYERLYINSLKSLSAKILLEEWTWVTKDDLSQKNEELKLNTFDITTKTDSLFKD